MDLFSTPPIVKVIGESAPHSPLTVTALPVSKMSQDPVYFPAIVNVVPLVVMSLMGPPLCLFIDKDFMTSFTHNATEYLSGLAD